MEPTTIAATALTILSPFVKDVSQKLVQTVGEIGVKKAEQLLGWLKGRFQGDPSAEKDLKRFETEPDKYQAGLQATIEEKVQSDPTFAGEFEKRLKDFGPQLIVFQQIKDGKDVTGIDAERIRSGKLSVTQHADKAEKLTGIRAKDIG